MHELSALQTEERELYKDTIESITNNLDEAEVLEWKQIVLDIIEENFNAVRAALQWTWNINISIRAAERTLERNKTKIQELDDSLWITDDIIDQLLEVTNKLIQILWKLKRINKTD